MEISRHSMRTGLWAPLALWLVGAALAPAEILTLDVRDNRLLSAPHVAFNTADRLYLAVWEYHYGTSDWDIDGHVVDANGQPVGDPFGIAWSGSIKQQEANVAYNPVTNQFLVAYSLSPGNWNVSACVVEGDGTPGPFIHIADTTFTELSPAVACDPTTGRYLAVYEREYMLDSVVWREVWAQDLLADGTRLGDPYRLSDPAAHSHQCTVACAGGQFLVVWTEQQTGGKSRILGRIIQCGYPSKTTFVLAQAKDSFQPQVAYNSARAEYLVVYQTRTNTTARWIIEGTRINTVGELNGTGIIASASGEHCLRPAVSCDHSDGTYVIAWAQEASDILSLVPAQRVMVTRADGLGVPVGISGQVGTEVYGEPAPAVASGICARSIVVWDDQHLTMSGGPSYTTTYSILAAHGTWGSLCCDPNCSSLE